ncbi:MAG: hypothetical protein M0Q91_04900 [Methanoregula sp.]|nr:hypothetical protein [Methanoregula sp.]
MTDEEIKEPDIFGIPENKNPMIIGIVVALLAIAVIAIVFLQLPSDSATLKPAVIHNNTSQLTTVSSSDTPKITKTTRSTGTQTVQQTLTIQATPSVPVDFILISGSPSSCGLTCRQLDASITNAGYATAHNVCIEVSMHNSRNEIINLNGVASLQQCVGDIAGGQSKTEPITINADCGAFATKCIGETLTLKTRVTSGEKSVQFPDQLIAV